MSEAKPSANITSMLKEARVFAPPAGFAANAHVKTPEDAERLRAWAEADPDGFWADAAKSLDWTTPYTKVCDWSDAPFARWFVGGKLNVSANCLDRHLVSGRKNKVAIHFEGEPGDTRSLTYQQLSDEVGRFANALKRLGVVAGDRVTIFLPMVPEAAIAMLACARIGAVHSVIFGGFSSESVAERNRDAGAKLLITADGGYRRGKEVPLKSSIEDAVAKSTTLERVVVLRRTGGECPMTPGRDVWWHDAVRGCPRDCPAEPFGSEHPLFILYTSGSTGKPKGVLHTSAGYLLGASWTHKYVFDIHDDDIYWCTADVGWITGHSYIVYGPLCNGATVVMYEGAPNYPHEGRFWEVVEKYRVSKFYTAPTAIRAVMKWGEHHPAKFDLTSLKLLGSVGEPINPEAWMWYHTHIGGGRCPIVDTWWQTETGAILIAPLPGATPTKPGSATKPLPGVAAEVVDKAGHPVAPGEGGLLVIRRPWPSMMRTIYGDDERYKLTYWSQIPGAYFTADGARRDADGDYWVMGRVDDVLNVSGHRLSTMEVESALVHHPAVAEAAVVGKPDELRGEAIVAFVTLKSGVEGTPELVAQLKQHVAKEIGALARPEEVKLTDSLPKTRSGKIMRRLLRDIAAGRVSTSDTSTLEDYSVLAKLREEDE